MIRFLDLQGQMYLDDIRTFTWYDTITNTFLEFAYSNYWHGWEEFEKDYHYEQKQGNIPELWPLERFVRLFPENWEKNHG